MNAVDLLLEMDKAIDEDTWVELPVPVLRQVMPELLDWAAHRSFFHPSENRELLLELFEKWRKISRTEKQKKTKRLNVR